MAATERVLTYFLIRNKLTRAPTCHPLVCHSERSEESALATGKRILRFAQNDNLPSPRYFVVMGLENLVIIVSSLALLAFIWRRDRIVTSNQRAGMFDRCLPLFDQPHTTQRNGEFPSLAANYRCETFELEAIPDTVGYRKIPSLWMQVTLAAKLPVNGTVDILARAQNIEFFSPSYDLKFALPVPAGWPQPIQFRSNAEKHDLDITQIEAIVGNMFSDGRIKELILTGRGLRVVYQLSQADKSRYLVFRMAEFEEITVNPDFLRSLMDDMLTLRDKVRAQPALELS